MAVFVHAGDQASARFAGKAGFHSGDIRIQQKLIGGGKMDLVLAVEAGDVPLECADHHGEGRGVHCLFRECRQVHGCRIMIRGVEATGIGEMGSA